MNVPKLSYHLRSRRWYAKVPDPSRRSGYRWVYFGSAYGWSWYCRGRGLAGSLTGNPIAHLCPQGCPDCCAAGLEFLAAVREKVSTEVTFQGPSAWPTVTEAADLLGVHRTTVVRMVKRDDLHSNGLVGRSCRIDPASIVAYRAGQRAVPRSEAQVNRLAKHERRKRRDP